MSARSVDCAGRILSIDTNSRELDRQRVLPLVPLGMRANTKSGVQGIIKDSDELDGMSIWIGEIP